jgi:glutathione S-transferase
MNIYLHHYPASLFSEKVRVMLGYLGLSWNSVIISSIMPRPLLMPSTGGYRKTPTLQIGANVYCDTAVIARGLARHAGDDSLFRPGFIAHRVAEWADTQLFRVAVALNFRPEALSVMMGQFSEEEARAFQADRAELAGGANLTTFSPSAASAYLAEYLGQLDAAIGEGFLFGTAPSIADFSVYHCLWFIAANPVNAPLLEPYPSVRTWMARIAAFGHGGVEEGTAEVSLAHARACEPVLPALDLHVPGGIALGDRVNVTPVDYGRVPVEGELVAMSVDEIVLARRTDETGDLMTHFPCAGFEVSKVQ